MRTYKFAGFPSTDSVAAAVTFSVCAWFLAAGSLIVAETPGAATDASAPVAGVVSPVVYTAPAVAIAPEARLIIVVEARRA